MKEWWDEFIGNPTLMRQVNGWLTLLFLALVPVSLALGWVESVVFVSALSLWALVASHWSAWQAARVEEKQDAADAAKPKNRPRKTRSFPKVRFPRSHRRRAW